MATRPAVFVIKSVDIQFKEKRVLWIRTGPGRAAPSRFTAVIETRNPSLYVALYLRLPGGDAPVIEQLSIRPGPGTAVSAGVLRGVLVDRLVQAAVKKASRRTTERPDVAAGAFQVQGTSAMVANISRYPGADERVRQAAELYRDALARGSRSPAADAAEAMNLSRAQIARYIRRARDARLLPPVGDVVRRRAPEESSTHFEP